MKRILCLISLHILLTAVLAAGTSDEDLANANNPLAGVTSINLHNYFMPVLSGASGDAADAKLNNFNLRMAQPFFKGRLLTRMTVPVNTSINLPAGTSTDIGSTNLFITYSFISRAKAIVGAGPMIFFPGTANPTRWQAGATVVMFFIPSPVIQLGALITWQASFAGLTDGNMLVVQPFFMFQIGNGFYLRSSGIMTFNFAAGSYNVPLGLGIGKVFKSPNGAVFNAFIEPQFSVYSYGAANPIVQLFLGFNTQFRL